MTESAAALLRLFAVLAAIAAFWFFGDRAIAFVQAPVKTQLDAARGNNKALKSGVDAQNKGVDAMKASSDEKVAASRAAVKAAGALQFARAAAIEQAPVAGESDYERAMNRIDRELNLR